MTARARSPRVLEGEVVNSVTEETDEKAPSLRKLGDIQVMMRAPNDAQVAMLIRLAKAAERDPIENFSRLADVFFRVVEALLVNPEDEEKMLDEIVVGRMTMAQITAGLIAEDKDAKAPNRRARRVR